jgi:hypothetical protein
MEAELIGAMAFAIGITAVVIGYWFERKHWRQASVERDDPHRRISRNRVWRDTSRMPGRPRRRRVVAVAMAPWTAARFA